MISNDLCPSVFVLIFSSLGGEMYQSKTKYIGCARFSSTYTKTKYIGDVSTLGENEDF